MTKVYIVRHAEAEGNIYRRLHGHYDGDLTENGLRQVAVLEERFRSIHLDAVYSSDLRRCRKTARALYEHKNLPLQLDTGLREMYMGGWEDRPWGELGHFDPVRVAQFQTTSPDFRAPEGGESFGELRERVSAAILRLAAKHEGETIGIATHYLALRAALSVFHGCGVDEINTVVPKCDNTGVSLLEIENGNVRIVFECDNSHLTPELSTLNRQTWKKSGNVAEASSNLWYRPWDPIAERTLYLGFRQDAWQLVHPDDPFDGEPFYRQALAASELSAWNVVCAMQGDRIAGLLQMDTLRYREEDAGFIYFYYVTPQVREHGLGVQLLGQAVSTFRPLERKTVRLRCSPDNGIGLHFYRKYGFHPIGCAEDSTVPLILLEKNIESVDG